PLRDTFRCITHPFAARRQGCPRAAARLACVKHAASVQSEPGSNSSVRSLQVTQSTLAPSPSTSVALCGQKQDSPPPSRAKAFCVVLQTKLVELLPGFNR